jgi:hypothetical protein
LGISIKRQHIVLTVTTALTLVIALSSPLFTGVQGSETGQTEVDQYLGDYDEESYPIGIQIEELEGNRQKLQ